MRIAQGPDPRMPWCPQCRAHVTKESANILNTDADADADTSIPKKVNHARTCGTCGTYTIVPFGDETRRRRNAWGFGILAVILTAGAMHDYAKGERISMLALPWILLFLYLNYWWIAVRKNRFRAWKKWANLQQGYDRKQK